MAAKPDEQELELLALIDVEFTRHPFYGSRKIRYGAPMKTTTPTICTAMPATAASALAAANAVFMRPGTQVAHAAGVIDKHCYTNSREAVLLNYGTGFRHFEVDFVRTRDGTVVTAHDGSEGEYGMPAGLTFACADAADIKKHSQQLHAPAACWSAWCRRHTMQPPSPSLPKPDSRCGLRPCGA